MNRTILKIGMISGAVAFTSTIAFIIAQALQLYGVLTFPTDERLIYGTSLCIVVPYLLEMLALHYLTPNHKKFWTHAAVNFTLMYAVFVSMNYVVQLATVIPAALEGSLEEVRILQQTPHSLFWDLDALGYICMGIATLFAIPVFKKTGFQRWVRLSFVAHGLTTILIIIVYFSPSYSVRLLLLAWPWAITAPLTMILLALMFNKRLQEPANAFDKNVAGIGFN
jgi:hypothetical protein